MESLQKLRDLFRTRPQAMTLRAGFVMRIIQMFARMTAWVGIANSRSEGKENIPKKGAVIIASNHFSYGDIFYVMGSINRTRGTVVARAGLLSWKNPPLAALLSFIGITGVKRGSEKAKLSRLTKLRMRWLNYTPDLDVNARAKRVMNWVLEKGGFTFVFPEGKLTNDGRLNMFYPQVVRLSRDNNCPIVPVALIGMKPGSFGIITRGAVVVKFLDPLYPWDFEDEVTMLRKLQEVIAEASGQEIAEVV